MNYILWYISIYLLFYILCIVKIKSIIKMQPININITYIHTYIYTHTFFLKLSRAAH